MSGIKDYFMSTCIKLIEPQDNNALYEIIVSVFKEFSAETMGVSLNDPEMKDIYRAYNSKGSNYWVVEQESGKVLGGGGYMKLQEASENENICEIQKFFLVPEARGKGFGTKIMELIMESAAKDGYQEIYLEILDSMKDATKLYKKFGFNYLDNRKGNTGHFSCKIFMGRRL